MSAFVRTSLSLLMTAGFVAVWASQPQSSPSLPTYAKVLTLAQGTEWRFNPLVVDLNKDGHVDLVATARLVDSALHVWLGDGKDTFKPIDPRWPDIGYGALATGDINADGIPDLVTAGHMGRVQTLLGNERGGFTEKVFTSGDGYAGAQLADLNEDGHLDLVLVGFQRTGLQIYFGDGTGDWHAHKTLPEPRPGPNMPGRAVAVGDLNHDRHLDLVVAFQRWGIYVFYGDGRGSFSGGSVDFFSASREFESIALSDVNNDGHPDIIINGTLADNGQRNGPDIYLGDGHGGWKASSIGLKVLKFATAGIALGDLDEDGNLDLVAAGNNTGDFRVGYGLFWFKGDGKGGWQLVRESGLPATGLSVSHSVTLADLDGDRVPEIIAVNGGMNGSITIWKRQQAPNGSR